VTLINTNGMAFIGPGSEWFWTALSGLVLAITFFAIYRQLRLQRSQAAIAQVTAIRAEWTSKAERHTRLAALIDLEHRAPADGMPPSAYGPANWFDRQGYLVQKGHLDLEEASSIFTDDLLFWWTICEPFVRQDRARHGLDGILSGFELFAKEVGRLWIAETGSAYVLHETIADQIDDYTALLQRHRDIERGIIPERKQAPPVPAQGASADTSA
jgi:hypothetical protein